MTVALVPLRTRPVAKRRLAHILDATAREALVATMLEHVVDVLATEGLDVVVLAAGPVAAPDGADVWNDDGPGLNAAVGAALHRAGTPAIVVPSDLPWIRTGDVRRLLEVPADVVVARSADGGTNGLVLRAPMRPAFGPGSAIAHARNAHRSGLRTAVVDVDGFREDVDDAASLRRAVACAPGLRTWQSAGARRPGARPTAFAV